MDERIEDYFESKLDEHQKKSFESDINQSPELLDEIAFYLQVKTAARQDGRDTELQEKHARWRSLDPPVKQSAGMLVRISIAAVLLIAVGLFWYLNTTNDNLHQQALSYVEQSNSTMPVLMGASDDQLQKATALYNKKDYPAAILFTESYLNTHPLDPEGLKIIGFSNVQLKKYDQALAAFHQITLQRNLYQNPGKFYEAMTYLCRNGSDDELKAKKLMQELIDNNQEGKSEALKWLEKSR